MLMKLARFFEILSPLSQYSGNITSQFGEDGIIDHIIKVIEPSSKYCVKFGAWDGKLYSNCCNLLMNHGWRGLMIEANSEKFSALAETFSGNQNVTPLNRFVDFEGADKLDNILREVSAPESFGLLSIDIDGNDYHVWESLKEYAPEVVVIEFNPTVPNDVIFIQDKSFYVNHGCSLMALILLGKQKGYELVVCTTINAFFVKAEKFKLLGVKNNFISNLYAPQQDGRIFNGYDGTIHVVGLDRIMWKDNLRVTSDDFPIFPKSMRVWSDAVKR